MSEFSLLKRILRHMRYRSLDEIIQQTMVLENWGRFNEKLTNLLNPVCHESQILNAEPLNVLAFAKYGLLDITLEVTQEILVKATSRMSIRFLHDMGWLDKGLGFAPSEEDSCLIDIWKDIDRGKAYIKVYLQAQNVSETEAPDIDMSKYDEKQARLVRKLLSLGGKNTLKQYLLPNEFKVTDAFLTNAPSIGMWQNFYL